MILNRLVTTLKLSTTCERTSAVKLGRLAFLEWLMSLPDDHNLALHARNAHARAAMYQPQPLALTVFCALLDEAAHNNCTSPELTQRRPRTRPASRSRKTVILHPSSQGT